ncbi:hypothetical protein CFIMG_007655RA00001 [Ceratocystis fimbriata CBS 114723]|uniref:Uncharacterized protein n=1 Tax=Ceratocystis fimbriata CBS 114723 TaxID=1035309 RepID=A0A2C5WVI4_9PEZI|nr:hypothetical protein CFIMG_007655RA00001 [Ceratocystis fimbriata CBS 114723]
MSGGLGGDRADGYQRDTARFPVAFLGTHMAVFLCPAAAAAGPSAMDILDTPVCAQSHDEGSDGNSQDGCYSSHPAPEPRRTRSMSGASLFLKQTR